MGSKDNYKTPNDFGIESDNCKISDFIRECDCLDDLWISIYLLGKEEFIYCNPALEKVVGSYSTKILNKNWNCWFDIVCKEELFTVKDKINNFFSDPYSTTSLVLKYHIIDEKGERIFISHELSLHYLEGKFLAINYFFDITEKEKIETFFKETSNFGENFLEKRDLISPREKEVLQLVADGFSSKQIANKLFISHHTAITHRKNLIEKFRVRNTAQLIKRASRNIELW